MVDDDGSTYEGDFKNGKMDGNGVKTWPSGNVYTGAFRNNLQHGPGKIYKAKTGETKAEEWREGKRWTWTKNDQTEEKVNPILHYKSNKQIKESGWAR